MPKPAGIDLKTLINQFTEQLTAVVENATAERMQAAVAQILTATAPTKRAIGRPPKTTLALLQGGGVAPRRVVPKQFCPVPGCTGTAAPAFGMVCGAHKNVAPTKIRKYREQRRAAKQAEKRSASAA